MYLAAPVFLFGTLHLPAVRFLVQFIWRQISFLLKSQKKLPRNKHLLEPEPLNEVTSPPPKFCYRESRSTGKKLQTSSISYVMHGQVEEETSFAHTCPLKGQSSPRCQRHFAFLQHICSIVIKLVHSLLCLQDWDHLKVSLPRRSGALILGNCCLRSWCAECLDLWSCMLQWGRGYTERPFLGWACSCSVASRMEHWGEGERVHEIQTPTGGLRPTTSWNTETLQQESTSSTERHRKNT